jgi:hypothetical protein
MSKEMYISSSPHETKVAVLEDDQLVEVYFERDTDVGLVGGIYKGRVSRVLPGMQSAFVDIGLERDAFLYVSDFYEDQEEYDKVFEEAEARATKFTTQQAGEAPPAAPPIAAVEAEAPAPAVPEVAPTLVTPVVAPTIAPPAPEQPAAAVTSPTPVFTPHPPRDSHERRGFDPKRGRRRRHRGRPEFGENRPVDRKFAPPTRTEEPPAESHSFEILPGESLAKYRNAGSSPAEEAATEYSEGTRSEFSAEGFGTVNEGNAPNGEAAALETGADQVNASPAVETVTAASEAQPAVVAAAPPEPRDEDTIVVADEPVPFTPGAIYSRTPSAGVESLAAAVANPVLDVPVPLENEPLPAEPEHMVEVPAPSVASAAEAAAAYSPEGIAAPSSGEDESSQSAPESPSERAELEVAEEDSDNEEEGLDEGEELAEGEVAAEAMEGQENPRARKPHRATLLRRELRATARTLCVSPASARALRRAAAVDAVVVPTVVVPIAVRAVRKAVAMLPARAAIIIPCRLPKC